MFGRIFKIQRFSLHDGPGIRTTVFLHGCPLRCPWCHNPESRASLKEVNGLFPIEEIQPEDLLREFEKDRLLYDESGGGVTFSGGEPLSQGSFLEKMLRLCQEQQIHTAVDTSGSGSPEAVAALMLADLVLFDIKGLNHEQLYRETGIDSRQVEAILERLALSQRKIWLRLPLIPGYGLMKEPAESLKAWFSPRSRWFERISLLPFHRTASRKYQLLAWENDMENQPDITTDQIEAFAGRLKSVHHDIRIGG